MSNHVDRFYAAVSVVASHGNIKQRIIAAFEDNLADIDDTNLPSAIRNKFIELRAMVTGVKPLNGEGHIRATVRKMSVVEAEKCSRKMLDLYTDLVHLEGEFEESPINIGDQARIPPFLVKSANS